MTIISFLQNKYWGSVLKRQLNAIKKNGLFSLLEASAKTSNIPLSFFLGLASRETNCVNELGDFRGGEAHGVGIVQIDIQHSIARQARDSGSWKTTPKPLIDFGANLLSENIAAAKAHLPNLTNHQYLKVAASGYNAGIITAINAAEHGNSDIPTTGRNYGADVLRRMSVFSILLARGNP